MLERAFAQNKSEDLDILFKCNFATNNVKFQLQELPQQLQGLILEYQATTWTLLKMGWQEFGLSNIMLEIIQVQIERKIEISREKFE